MRASTKLLLLSLAAAGGLTLAPPRAAALRRPAAALAAPSQLRAAAPVAMRAPAGGDGQLARLGAASASAAAWLLVAAARTLAASTGVPVRSAPVDVVKWGVGVGGALAGAAYVLASRSSRKSKQAAAVEPPAAQPELDADVEMLNSLQARMRSLYDEPAEDEPPAETTSSGGTALLERPDKEEAAPAEEEPLPEVDEAFLADDSLVLGDLARRMREIADAPPPAPPAPADDFGSGGTALLEPPRSEEARFDADAPPPTFPDGFPLRDFDSDAPLDAPADPADRLAKPSDDEIAMLKRMMGEA